ncbi:hypothetical protein VKT23_013751 [Stygiomarasmius scandens]|uniref:Protein kinase domain-containing protein n=1 Tax=Marasmiellus scandens TaxID=2682957 RepID=A0ABR1J1G5_9AGAR
MTSRDVRLKCKCYVFTGEKLSSQRSFSLVTQPYDTVKGLAQKVKNETQIKSHITLYKAEDLYCEPVGTIHERVGAWLEQHIEEALDDVFSGLAGEIWPEGGDWSLPRKYDLVAVDQSALNSLQIIRSLPDPALRLRTSTINEHISLLESLATAPSPSSGSHNPESCYTGPSGARGGRPATYHGPSNALFDPYLAQLSHELRNLHLVEVTSEVIHAAYRLLTISANFYPDDSARGQAVQLILREIFPGGVWQTRIANGQAKPVAFWLLSLIFELKNEKGNGGDPEVQTILDYIKILSDEELSGHFRTRSNCPSILLSLAGEQLNISTAICTDAVYVEGLYTENLRGSYDLDDRVLRLAQVLQSVKNAFDGLSLFYTGLRANDLPADGSALFPRPVHADAPHPELIDTLGLCFLYKLSRKGGLVGDDQTERQQNMYHALYVALSDGASSSIPAGEVLVKFAQRYNVHAHKLLADADLAPKLYYHCPVLGGYTMVVMERITGHMAWTWELGKLKMPHAVYAGVERAVGLLHHEDIVFGDLRLPNIMVRRDDHLPFLVDFDWAAKEGEGRYPATLFVEGIDNHWASGVERYGLMAKEHDLYMLKRLKNACEMPE